MQKLDSNWAIQADIPAVAYFGHPANTKDVSQFVATTEESFHLRQINELTVRLISAGRGYFLPTTEGMSNERTTYPYWLGHDRSRPGHRYGHLSCVWLSECGYMRLLPALARAVKPFDPTINADGPARCVANSRSSRATDA